MKRSSFIVFAFFGAFILSSLVIETTAGINGKRLLADSPSTYSGDRGSFLPSPLQTYLSHTPIYVQNDTELAATSVNPSSTGAAADPYILEGWNLSNIYVLHTTKHFIIRNCWINGSTWQGIYIWNVSIGTCTVTDNIMQTYGPGVMLSTTESAIIANNTCHYMEIKQCSYTNITSNNCSVGNGIQLETCANMSVSNNLCSGIVLDGVLSSTLFNNTCRNSSVGINVDNSSYCTLLNNTCYGHDGAGISVFGDSRWNVIEGNQCYLNYWGIRDYSNRYSTISTNDLHHNNQSGIICESSPDPIIVYNRCYENAKHGIDVEGSTNAHLGGNNCSQNTDRGIYIANCPNSTISHNICNQNSIGLSIDLGNSYTIVKNRLSENWDGFLFQNGQNLMIKNNTLHLSTNRVLRMANCHSCVLEWNRLVENSLRMVIDAQSASNKLHHNVFIKNHQGVTQALDNGSNNQWYDPITEEGNYWSDYAGEGNYSIAGAAGTADIYPANLSVIFNVSQFANLTFEEGTTGHQLNWTVFSIFHTHYEIYQDGVLVESDIWNGSQIVYSLDNLDPGTYNITIVLSMLGTSEASSAFITVEKVKSEEEDNGLSSTIFISTVLLGLIIASLSIAVLWRKKRKQK